MASVKGHLECFRFLVENRLFKAVGETQKYQVLIDACRRRDFDHIERILVGIVDWDFLNGWKGNSLMSLFVAYRCPPSCLQVLIDQGVDVNGVDYNGFTPLMCAVLTENIILVRFLLSLGVDINAGAVNYTSYFVEDGTTRPDAERAEEGETALMYAACFRNNESLREMLQYCVDNDVDVNRSANTGPWSAVDYAAYFGHRDSVSLLIKSSCYIRPGHQMSYMSIHYFAMVHHRPDILELTLGADPNFFDFLFLNGDQCVSDVHCLRVLLKYVNNHIERQNYLMMFLQMAADNGKIDCFRLLLEQAPEINHRDNGGDSILMRLCKDMYKEVFDLLIKWGADIHVQDNDGNTVVMCAAKNKAVKCLEQLVAKGASIHVRNEKEETPLMIACASGHAECVDLLIRSGADVTAQTNDRRTTAAYPSTEKCLQQLMAHGADIYLKDERKKKTLMFACENGFDEVVEFLIKCGLDINAQDESGTTAMMYAIKGCNYVSDHAKCLKVLLDEGANLDLIDNERGTVFSIAMCGNGSCVDVLLHSGKLLCDGVLKPEHRHAMRVMNKVDLWYQCVMSAMEFGVFEWDWCLLADSLRCFVIAAVQSGFSLGKIKYKDAEISPLHLAFIESDFRSILHLLANCYIFPEDLGLFSADNAVIDYNNIDEGWHTLLFDIIEKFKIPLSLQTLSFLATSTLLPSAKSPSERSNMVDTLPLSEEMKTRLKFKTNISQLLPTYWVQQGIDKVFDCLNFKEIIEF